jgi:hypothetical protein
LGWSTTVELVVLSGVACLDEEPADVCVVLSRSVSAAWIASARGGDCQAG